MATDLLVRHKEDVDAPLWLETLGLQFADRFQILQEKACPRWCTPKEALEALEV